MGSDRPGSGGLVSAALVALLELVERPAAAIADTGTILGGNAGFLELAVRHGKPPHDRIDALVDGGTLAALLAALAAGRGAHLMLGLTDGVKVSARADVVPLSGGERLLVVTVERPEAARATGPKSVNPSTGVATLRHDIAGPLTAILGTAELMLLRGGDRLPPDIRENLGHILEHCGHLSEILHRSRTVDQGRGQGPAKPVGDDA